MAFFASLLVAVLALGVGAAGTTPLRSQIPQETPVTPPT